MYMNRKWKTATLCALLLLLTCCSAPAPSGESGLAAPEETPLPQKGFEAPFEMISSPDRTSYGSGTREGFYSAFLNEDDSRNILYVDYASASQVYLCAQPNCEHNSESCSAWIAPFGGTVTMAAGEKELFLLYNGYGGGACIERAGLNGENRQELVSLPDGAMAENAVAFNGQFLVLSLRESGIENDAVVQNNRLVAVDVNSGETRTLFSLRDHLPEEEPAAFSMRFLGVTDEGFLLETSVQEKYDATGTEEEIFQKMDAAFHTVIWQVPFDGTPPMELFTWGAEQGKGIACANAFFFVEQQEGGFALKKLEQGKVSTLCPDLRAFAPERDPESFRLADVVLRGSVKNKLLLNLLTKAYTAENGNIEAVYSGFAVDADTGETTPLTLTNTYSATTVPVQVLDAHGPKLLVFADISQTVDKAANALSLRRRMGLIAPEDYLNGRAEYQMIDSLRDFG